MSAHIAIYGKGGIGKTTISVNLALTLAASGRKVLLVGCDPKRDTARLLLRESIPTIVEKYDEIMAGRCLLETVCIQARENLICCESGGPRPGVGCAGRGVLISLELLRKRGALDRADVVLYDVLGDVVCGGFATPVTRGYAERIFVVTSGEQASLLAANNILAGMEAVGGQIGMIFQEPMTSLNPVLTVGKQIDETLKAHTPLNAAERRARIVELLRLVGIPEPEKRMKCYPFELSGGMKQRVMIAMALSCEPKMLIADEPTTALDVSVQAQIINLLRDLQKEYGYTYLFVAHGLNVVRYMSDRIGVMYLGRIVEMTDTQTLFRNPLHPYTQALLNAIPDIDSGEGVFSGVLSGDVPSPVKLPEGCPFHPRCSRCMEICKREMPQIHCVGDTQVMCHLYDAHQS